MAHYLTFDVKLLKNCVLTRKNYIWYFPFDSKYEVFICVLPISISILICHSYKDILIQAHFNSKSVCTCIVSSRPPILKVLILAGKIIEIRNHASNFLHYFRDPLIMQFSSDACHIYTTDNSDWDTWIRFNKVPAKIETLAVCTHLLLKWQFLHEISSCSNPLTTSVSNIRVKKSSHRCC